MCVFVCDFGHSNNMVLSVNLSGGENRKLNCLMGICAAKWLLNRHCKFGFIKN